jgi:oligosaccharide repeat unit polymerase
MKKGLSFVLALITFIISLLVVTENINELNIYITIHILIIALSSFSLFNYENRPYSLYKIFHIFNLFFFGIAPVLQYVTDTRFNDEHIIPYDFKILTSLIILFSNILFNIIYSIVNLKLSSNYLTKLHHRLNAVNTVSVKFKSELNLLMIGLSALCFFMILQLNNYNILSMLFRGGLYSETIEVEKSSLLLINKFFQPLALVLFIISFLYNRKAWVVNIVLFSLFFITDFPLALGRNAVAGFYLPLLLLFIPIFRKGHYFVSTMIFGLLIVFPFLDGFRNFNKDTNISFGLNFDMFTQMHFDAYATFTRVIYYDIITYGNQLLGVIFFFVPRSIWPSKPLSSGQFHAQLLRLDFDNLSCTYLAEGYINFGFLGVFIFLFFIAYWSSLLDKTYWLNVNKNSYFNVIYILLIGMFLFVLRGDLMNSYAYSFGLIFSAFFGYKLILFFLLKNAKKR